MKQKIERTSLQKIPSPSQKGFSSVLLLILLATGIIAGTLLVQNGTSFLPQAANDCSSLETEHYECTQIAANVADECADVASRLEACRNPQTPSEPDKSSGSDSQPKNVDCESDKVTYCDNRSGTPRAIRKTGGYYTDDPSDPNYASRDSKGCVFDFFEVPEKKNECAKSESKSGDVVQTTEEEAERLDKNREDTRVERERSGGAYKDTTFCSADASKTYHDAKVANNLARFYAIQKGAGGLCVPADLGVPVKDDVTVNGVEGRLMLCSTKENPQLYWMISSYKDNSLIVVPEEVKTAPDINNLQFPNLQKARCVAGLDQGEVCNGV